MSVALDILIFITGWTHVLIAPYNKVEESFTLHATHDVLMYGVKNIHNYDHFVFSGAVPRTFVGSVLLAWLSMPVIRFAEWLGLLATKFDLQVIVRLVLTSINALGLCLVRRAVSRRFGRLTGFLFTLLTCSQFHLPFWMGRTIPNMIALFPVNIAASLLIDRAPNATKPSERSVIAAIFFLTFSAVILRAEIVLLLGPLCLQLLVSGQIAFSKLVKVGIMSGLGSIALTVIVDSYFWDEYPIWPEFSSIYFNVVEGKSSQWGVSPPYAYLSSYLPKLLLGSLPLSTIGFIIDSRIRGLLVPSAAFIILLSNLGHKEWRFIIYVVPFFNVAAARGARSMVSRGKGTLFGRILFLIVAGIITGNYLLMLLSLRASIVNYPGGQALSALHYIHHTIPAPHVHISNLAAQTGASLFLQLNAPPYHIIQGPRESWSYDKTENLTLQQLTASSAFTHLISEVKPSARIQTEWKVIHSVQGFDRWAIDWELLMGRSKGDLLRRVWNVVRLVQSDKLWILERL